MPNVDINGTVVSFPDEMQPDQLKQAVSKAASKITNKPNLTGQNSFQRGLGTVAAKYANFMGPEGGFGGNPAGKLMSMIQKPMQKAGEATATGIAQKFPNIPPQIPAAIGTAVQMAPDIATSAIPAGRTMEVPEMAIPLQRRAYGFQKSLLKTPFARGKASMAAKTGLEKNITSATGNPDVMMNKASALAGRTGQKIGDIRKAAGPQPVDRFIKALDDYKEARLKGATGGKWAPIEAKIEEAKNTIKGLVSRGTIEPQDARVESTGILGPQGKEITRNIPAVEGFNPPSDLQRIAAAKKQIGDIVNWFSENVGQGEAKKITGVIEKATEDAIRSSGGDIKTYKALKPIYGAMKTIQKGLNNEIAGQQGNMAASLPSQVMAGAEAAATGSPGKAMAALGVTELLKRRGTGAGANLLKSAYQSRPQVSSALISLLRKLREDSDSQR